MSCLQSCISGKGVEENPASWLQPVRTVDVAGVNPNQYLAGAGISGAFVAAGDRVLRTSGPADSPDVGAGIWVVQPIGPPVRADDLRVDPAAKTGTTVRVADGNFAGAVWYIDTPGNISIGTTPFHWERETLPGGPTTGAEVTIDASGFNGNLDSSVTDAQLLADAVDSLAVVLTDQDWKKPVRTVSTNGQAPAALIPGAIVEGVLLAVGDRVLIPYGAAGTLSATSGIYVVQVSGPAIRSVDFDDSSKFETGTSVRVGEGTFAGTLWYVATPGPIVLGTTPYEFEDASKHLPVMGGFSYRGDEVLSQWSELPLSLSFDFSVYDFSIIRDIRISSTHASRNLPAPTSNGLSTYTFELTGAERDAIIAEDPDFYRFELQADVFIGGQTVASIEGVVSFNIEARILAHSFTANLPPVVRDLRELVGTYLAKVDIGNPRGGERIRLIASGQRTLFDITITDGADSGFGFQFNVTQDDIDAWRASSLSVVEFDLVTEDSVGPGTGGSINVAVIPLDFPTHEEIVWTGAGESGLQPGEFVVPDNSQNVMRKAAGVWANTPFPHGFVFLTTPSDVNIYIYRGFMTMNLPGVVSQYLRLYWFYFQPGDEFRIATVKPTSGRFGPIGYVDEVDVGGGTSRIYVDFSIAGMLGAD